MARELVPDCLRELIKPLLPKQAASCKGGRPRAPDRQCLVGILFVLRTGIPSEDLPQELGCGSFVVNLSPYPSCLARNIRPDSGEAEAVAGPVKLPAPLS